MTYDLTLKGFVGGWDFDSDYIDYVLNKKKDCQVNVLIDSLGGYTNTGLSVSSAFRNHGNVHVTFRGMNASAATIAALGAKHVSIESDALYLIHKCSVRVFEWADMNEEQLKQKIEELEHTRQNSMKIDVAVAQAYARRTGKTKDELLSLMSKELWLTAEEAKEYGFVDEVLNASEEGGQKEMVITSSMEDKFKEAGLPIPSMLKHEDESFFAKLTKLFKSDNSKTMDQNQNTQEQAAAQEQQQAQQQSAAQTTAQTTEGTQSDLQTQVQTLTDSNKSLSDENARLKSEIEALKKKPVDSPSSVVNNGGGEEKEDEENDFLSTMAEAKKLSNFFE